MITVLRQLINSLNIHFCWIVCLGVLSCVKQRDLTQNTVIIQIGITPDGLHPTNVNSSVASLIATYTQQSLIGINLATEEDIPLLIKQLPQVDSTGLVYEFELIDGVFWDDGSPLTVKDIIFTTKINLSPLTDNAQVRPIFSSVIDSVYPSLHHPMRFYLKCKTIHILNKDILGGFAVLQQQHWDSLGVLNDLHFHQIHQSPFISKPSWDNWFNSYNSSDNAYNPKKLVGLGPYQVVKFEKDDFIKLQKKENWWAANQDAAHFKALPQELLFKVIADNAAVYLAIKNQQIDFTQNAGGIAKLIKLQNLDYFNQSYHSEFVSGYSYNYLGLNMRPDGNKQAQLFKDQKVRKAIAHLIPVEEIIEVMYYNKAVRQASIVSPLKAACDTSLNFIPYDVELAKQLLKDAGWVDTDNDLVVDKVINGKKTPLAFKLNYVSSGSAKDIVLMMKDALKKAGVELIPNPMDFNSLYKNAANHTFDAMLGGWLAGSGYSDPTQLWSTESWTNKGSNFCGFGSAYSDSLIVAANTSLNDSLHLVAYKELQRLIYEEQPYIFLWSAQSPMVAHKRFKGTTFYRVRPNVNLGAFELKNLD